MDTMTTDSEAPSTGSGSEQAPMARQAVKDLMDAGLMDDVLARIDGQDLRLTVEAGSCRR